MPPNPNVPPYASPVPFTPPAPPATPPAPGLGDQVGFWNADPIAGFWEYLRAHGWNQVDPTSKYAQNQYNRTYSQFQGDAASDPTMGFYDYLNGRTGKSFDYGTEYTNQAPDTRGDYGSRTYSAKGRWVTPR